MFFGRAEPRVISGRPNFRVSPAPHALSRVFLAIGICLFSLRDPIHHEQIRKTHGGKREREGWPGERRGKTKNEGERRNGIQQTICLALSYLLLEEIFAYHA